MSSSNKVCVFIAIFIILKKLYFRQFDAMNRSMAMDNSGYSPDSDGASKNISTKLPKTTYNLLECPVCLEIAWPPKKIFQCREGHIVCDTCKANPNLKTCPMCRIPLSSNLTSRNRWWNNNFITCNGSNDFPLGHLRN